MDKESQSNSIKILLPIYDTKMPSSNTKGNHVSLFWYLYLSIES